jgi:signal peptidase I
MPNASRASSRPAKGGTFEAVRTIIEALLIAVVFRTLLFQPFTIPSGSMEPTLLVGDYLFVSKYSYGYSHYALPFSPPLFSGRIFASLPNRGDVIVFRHGAQDFIKRLIGLPGDKIQVKAGLLYINGTAVTREPASDFIGHNPCGPTAPDSPPVRVKRWHETLPNGVNYSTLECGLSPGLPDFTDVYTVPPDHFFMMGDNRENSEDSRFPDVGYVPFENLIGKAQIIFFSIAGENSAYEVWKWPEAARWGRLFTLVR